MQRRSHIWEIGVLNIIENMLVTAQALQINLNRNNKIYIKSTDEKIYRKKEVSENKGG
jgi:hypothetical protein